jgi:8-oxo-dGTP pyrophosphatase MutT (NUDIX family)
VTDIDPQRTFSVASIAAACSRLGEPREPLYYFHTPEVLIPSALVIPVVEVDGIASLVLTKRPATMKNHAGDWVFPGGRIDEGIDADPTAAAYRELEEELGVPQSSARIIGELDMRGPTLQGHTISVFVAVLDSIDSINADEHEVSEVAIVSLEELANPDCHYSSNQVPYGYGTHKDDVEPRQLPVTMQFFKFGDGQLVWGTQGEILWDLLACLLEDRKTIAQIRS